MPVYVFADIIDRAAKGCLAAGVVEDDCFVRRLDQDSQFGGVHAEIALRHHAGDRAIAGAELLQEQSWYSVGRQRCEDRRYDNQSSQEKNFQLTVSA